MTFTQFLLTFLLTVPSQISFSNYFLKRKPNVIPLRTWTIYTALFLLVNLLNNAAFNYRISVPVHIILRSGGSVTTMFVGFLAGKRFTRLQVLSVTILTIGVILAAYSDAYAKGKTVDDPSKSSSTQSFAVGLLLLLVAQLLSAVMGLYIQNTYAKYGGHHWRENLFFSHFLSLPLFSFFAPSLLQQYHSFLASESLASRLPALVGNLPPQLQPLGSIPFQMALLGLNASTQYACIRGVNLLSSRTSALTVTIVLNVRKLVSLLLSIWIFGNALSPGVLVGALVVFTGGGIYGWESQRAGRKASKQKRIASGEVKKVRFERSEKSVKNYQSEDIRNKIKKSV